MKDKYVLEFSRSKQLDDFVGRMILDTICDFTPMETFESPIFTGVHKLNTETNNIGGRSMGGEIDGGIINQLLQGNKDLTEAIIKEADPVKLYPAAYEMEQWLSRISSTDEINEEMVIIIIGILRKFLDTIQAIQNNLT